MRTYCIPRPVLFIAAPLALALACSPGDGETDPTEDPTEDPTAEPTEGTTGVENAPTWHGDIAPLVSEKCSGCHRSEGIAPFALTDYETASPWAELLAAAVEAGTMPPFGADDTDECQPRFGWKNDIRLSDDEKALLRAWSDAGAPEGDPAAAAPLIEPPPVELEDADERVTAEVEYTVDGPNDEFVCFVLDPGLTEDAYLAASQIIPGNDKIVHHVLVYTDSSGESEELAGDKGYYDCPAGAVQGDRLIAAWAPGALPNETPPNSGYIIPADSRIVINVHYHPTGAGAETDPGTAIDLKWFDGKPDWITEMALVGNFDDEHLLPGPNDNGGPEFRVPANAEAHTETMAYTLQDDEPEIKIWMVGTHMHYVGYDMIMGVQRANPNIIQPPEECLLQTPHYSFEWQRSYVYDTDLSKVPTVQHGDTLTFRCTYNNSMSNPYVVEALDELGLSEPIDVWLGEETLDEMCLGVYGIALPRAVVEG